jgi:regulator of sigma E protease
MTILIILFVIIGLSLLILTHEAGHFVCAKLFGLKVDEFGIGFPPRIFAWKKGETEYSINWLPFGGFVKIGGERGEFALEEELAKDAGGAPAKAENSAAKSPATAVQPDEKRLFYAQPAWKKSIILLAGVFMNFIIGWLLVSFALTVGAPKALIISDVEAGSPAAAVGLAQGDIIKNFQDSADFIAFVNAHRGQAITVDVLRNNKELNLSVVPRVATAANEGAIGVYLEDAGHPGENVLAALWDGLMTTGALMWLTLVAFGQLVQQLFIHGSLMAGVVGPVGIFGVAEETGKIGATYFIQFLGVISINLAVVNLIPFPALDGGRFVMTVIEKIKGSPVPEKVEAWVNGLGFAFLLVLMVLLTIRDVGHLL